MEFLLVMAGAALLSVALGVVGGKLRDRATRRELDEVWDSLDALSKRLSKREGVAGREQRASVPAAAAKMQELGALAALMRTLGGAPAARQGPQLVEPEDAHANAVKFFHAKDRASGE